MREIKQILTAQPTSDGAGVKLNSVFGGKEPRRFDPFLLLDEFGSEEGADYIAGFPSHSHRGFETVTYMLQGKMLHEDHLGNRGLLNDGDVQWMTAARDYSFRNAAAGKWLDERLSPLAEFASLREREQAITDYRTGTLVAPKLHQK